MDPTAHTSREVSEMGGWTFLHIRTAEGGHSPANAHITAEEYEASRSEMLELLKRRRQEILDTEAYKRGDR